jgi:hypothetical protein
MKARERKIKRERERVIEQKRNRKAKSWRVKKD